MRFLVEINLARHAVCCLHVLSVPSVVSSDAVLCCYCSVVCAAAGAAADHLRHAADDPHQSAGHAATDRSVTGQSLTWRSDALVLTWTPHTQIPIDPRPDLDPHTQTHTYRPTHRYIPIEPGPAMDPHTDS